MASKTLVNGTAYEIKGGKTLVGGTGYSVKQGKTLVDGTGYDIKFGKPISSITTGSTVNIKVRNTIRQFIVIQHGRPSTAYAANCDGTWLLMKDIYENRKYDDVASGQQSNDYENSTIHAYLNGIFLNNYIDSAVRDIIKQVNIPYVQGEYLVDGDTDPYTVYGTVCTGTRGLSTKVFLLSATEVGFTPDGFGDWNTFISFGAKISYFSSASKRIAYLDGEASKWSTRSPRGNGAGVMGVYTDGSQDMYSSRVEYGIRPAFIVPSDTLIDPKTYEIIP